MKISLDSNCFKNLDFIDFLIENTSKIEIHLSIIAYIETLIWYKFKGLSVSDFESDINNLEAKIDLLSKKSADKISDIVIEKNSELPFKIHARDYFIAGLSEFYQTILITYNVRHFDTLVQKILTPERFVKSFITKE